MRFRPRRSGLLVPEAPDGEVDAMSTIGDPAPEPEPAAPVAVDKPWMPPDGSITWSLDVHGRRVHSALYARGDEEYERAARRRKEQRTRSRYVFSPSDSAG
jgi:hypothetical protein